MPHDCDCPPTSPLSRRLAGYSINSILYQRGIYPPETFRRVNKYGLTMLVTTDDALNAYLENVLTQLSGAHIPSPSHHGCPMHTGQPLPQLRPGGKEATLPCRQSGWLRARCRSLWWW